MRRDRHDVRISSGLTAFARPLILLYLHSMSLAQGGIFCAQLLGNATKFQKTSIENGIDDVTASLSHLSKRQQNIPTDFNNAIKIHYPRRHTVRQSHR